MYYISLRIYEYVYVFVCAYEKESIEVVLNALT